MIAKGLRYQPLRVEADKLWEEELVEVHRRLRRCTAVTARRPAPPPAAAASPDSVGARPRSTAFWAAFAAARRGVAGGVVRGPGLRVLAVAFGGVDPVLRTADPEWNPLAVGLRVDAATCSTGSFGGDLGARVRPHRLVRAAGPDRLLRRSATRSPTTSPARPGRSQRPAAGRCSCCRSGSAT